MSANSTTIFNEILGHINKDSAKFYNEYYVGITNDIERRLFNEHNVPKDGHCFIYRKATSEKDARDAESWLLKKGMKGGSGGGGIDSVYVYCYRITSLTKE